MWQQAHQSTKRLAVALADIEVQLEWGLLRDIVPLLQEVSLLAAELGFPDLVRAAENAKQCLPETDAAAIGATLSRVLILGKLTAEQVDALRMHDG